MKTSIVLIPLPSLIKIRSFVRSLPVSLFRSFVFYVCLFSLLDLSRELQLYFLFFFCIALSSTASAGGAVNFPFRQGRVQENTTAVIDRILGGK